MYKKDYSETKDLIVHLILGFIILIIGLYWLSFSIKETRGLKCIDGDTFAIGNKYYRLSYIDTAEKDMPTYVASSEFTCNYLKDKTIVMEEHGKDIYGRTLVVVFKAERQFSYSIKMNLNELLVSKCLAIPFYGNTTEEIIELYSKCK